MGFPRQQVYHFHARCWGWLCIVYENAKFLLADLVGWPKELWYSEGPAQWLKRMAPLVVGIILKMSERRPNT